MIWFHHSNRRLVEAIVASFRDEPEVSARRFADFKRSDWMQSEFWLDTSGLALYFLNRIELIGIASSIDPRVLSELREKMAHNQERTADMLQEFVALNRAFSNAGLCYANLKGFTLSPASCSDQSLRHQSDYDFLIDPADLHRGRILLEERGYRVTGATARTLEFKCGHTQQVSLQGHYKSKALRAVELHTAIESTNPPDLPRLRDERLDRRVAWSCGTESFPALSAADQFLGQALHLLGHLRGEHTRPSWLLEFKQHAVYRQDDTAFWQAVERLACNRSEETLAVGLSLALAAELFGSFPRLPACDRFQQALPVTVRLWAEMYGRQAVLAEVPGTKLCHLLEQAITDSPPASSSTRSLLQLLPLRAPPRILHAPVKDTLRLRLGREWIQLQYILYRTCFHLKEGLRIRLESRRWRQALKRVAASRQCLGNGRPNEVFVREGRNTR